MEFTLKISRFFCLAILSAAYTGTCFSHEFLKDASGLIRGTLDPLRVSPATFTLLGPNPFPTVTDKLTQGPISIYDESNPQGNATTLNFTGTAVSVACSGSTCTITVTASGGGGGGGGFTFDGTSVVAFSTITIEGVRVLTGAGDTVSTFSLTTSSLNYTATQMVRSSVTIEPLYSAGIVEGLTLRIGSTTIDASGVNSPLLRFVSRFDANGLSSGVDLTTAAISLQMIADGPTSPLARRSRLAVLDYTDTEVANFFQNGALVIRYSPYPTSNDGTSNLFQIGATSFSITGNGRVLMGGNGTDQNAVIDVVVAAENVSRPILFLSSGAHNTRILEVQTSSAAFYVPLFASYLDIQSSATVRGIIISSTGFQIAASTVQGSLLLEGGTVQFRNGANEFSIAIATALQAGILRVANVTGNRALIMSGSAPDGSPINTAQWNAMNSSGMARAVYGYISTGTHSLAGFAVAGASNVTGGQLFFEGSSTIKGIVISSAGALLGGTTIQGVFLVEGGTFQFRNGENEFSLVFTTRPNAGEKLTVTSVVGNRVTISGGKDADSGGAAGGPDPSLQNPATGFFNMNAFGIGFASQVAGGQLLFEGSSTVRGIYVSSTGFQVAASTVQGSFMLEGGTIQFRNGTNEFSVTIATALQTGGVLRVVNVTGGRALIMSGAAPLGSPITTSDWNIMNTTGIIGTTETAPKIGVFDGVSQVKSSSITILTPYGIASVANDTEMSSITVLSSTSPWRSFTIPAQAFIGAGVASASWANAGIAFTSVTTSVRAFNRIPRAFHEMRDSTYSFCWAQNVQMPYNLDVSTGIRFQAAWWGSSGTANTNAVMAFGAINISSGASAYPVVTSSVAIVTTYVAAEQMVYTSTGMQMMFMPEGSPVAGGVLDIFVARLGGDGRDAWEGFTRLGSVTVSYKEKTWDGYPR